MPIICLLFLHSVF